jgi:CRP-like cAMP-binding protein
MALQLMPAAQLEPSEGDIHLSNDQFMQLSLFAQLTRKPTLDKYPGTMVIRRFRKGELMFRQGEAGWTAFYLLTTEDVLKVLESQYAEAGPTEKRALEEELINWKQRQERIRRAPEDETLRRVATVYLAVARTDRQKQRSAMARFLQLHSARMSEGPVKNADEKTLYIPVDGPVTLNYESLKAVLKEGELFGEMSCMYRTPRSATVRADRDCYALEMLRNILDQVQKDPQYKSKSDEIYKKRVFELQIRKLSIFRDLTDAEFNELRDGVELVSLEPGTLICDEHDRSDSLYIVRSGMVKVMKNVTSLLAMDDVLDWVHLIALLKSGEAKPTEPAGRLWQLLPERIRTILLNTAPERLNSPDRVEIVQSLNDVIKTPGLLDYKEFATLKEKPPLRDEGGELLARRAELVKKKKELPDSDLRRLHRLLLDTLLAGVLRPLSGRKGLDCVLSYLSRGDYFGEIGLMMNHPRSATCLAYGHPNDVGQVELVKLPSKTFWKLIRASQPLRERVKAEIALRRRYTMERLLTPAWDETNQVQFSETFEQLGLIQGQQLMLIDLDRCTRCDECVKACVRTHDDGHTRLFLDGPRFGKYLVPTSCRSCLDPVCMIGCPVGSIHRGDNRQIVIEDWCIGCSLCADNCPYGSILMHDLGLLSETAQDWRWSPATEVEGDRWKLPGYRDHAWLDGESPFHLDRDFKEQLASFRGRAFASTPRADDSVLFRREFDLPARVFQEVDELLVVVTSLSSTVQVWVNGIEVEPDEKPKRGRREFTLALKPKPKKPVSKVVDPAAKGVQDEAIKEQILPFRKGRNCLAVKTALSTKPT